MAKISSISASLDEETFQRAAANFPRMEKKSLKVAHAILVEGKTFEELATIHKISRQLAHNWASKIFGEACPKGWVTKKISLPPNLMDEVEKLEKKARVEWKASLPPGRIVRD